MDGGVISFKFKYPVKVEKIGLLDIDYKSFLRVYLPEQGSKDIDIPNLGDNSAQTFHIDKDGVEQLDLNLGRSGAVSFLSFCSSENGMTDKVGIGEPCLENSDCDTDACWIGLGPLPGICVCTREKGCEGEFECVGPAEVLEALGIYDASPSCQLPVGASCDPQQSFECLTGVCNEETSVCGCYEETNYPCDTDDGERCAYDSDRGLICMAPGDGSLGSPCFENTDCVTDSCFFGISEPPGICQCNLETNAGCEGAFICGDLSEPRFSFDLPFVCKLPIDAPCDPKNSDDCLTANCDEVTNLCACSLITNYPCDVGNGEICLLQATGYVCKVPFPIGSDCALDSECETRACHIFTPGFSGTCSCNTETNEGCDDESQCYSSDVIAEAQGVVKPLPNCFLPVDSICDHTRPETCLTGNCDEGVCTCNVYTHYPCMMKDERCLLDLTGRYVCTPPGDGSIGSRCFENSHCDTDNCEFGAGPFDDGTIWKCLNVKCCMR